MKKKTEIAQISILVITLLLTAFPVRADDLPAPVPAPADFWVRDQPGRITHALTGTEPLVLCMQGRKVVMQVQCDRTNGFSYTARFFNLLKEVEKKKALFVAGRDRLVQVAPLLAMVADWRPFLNSTIREEELRDLRQHDLSGFAQYSLH